MVALTINGESKTVDAPPDMPLLWVLRDLLGMTGTKFGCGIAQCGACTVHLDGKPVRSCLLPVGAIGNRAITTIEGVGATPSGAKVQKAWLDLEVIQCGYCQSGQIMSAAALLETHAAPRRCRYRCGDGGQYLPLRHLCAHPRGDQARRGRAGIGGRRESAQQAFARHAFEFQSAAVAPRADDGRLGRRLRARIPPAGEGRERAGAAARQSGRPVRAQRLHPYRSCRQDHAGDAAGGDGPGRLYRHRHDPRRRARCRFRRGDARACAAQRQALWQSDLFGIQATGNSNSIRAFWKPLRVAGADGTGDAGGRPPPANGRSIRRAARRRTARSCTPRAGACWPTAIWSMPRAAFRCRRIRRSRIQKISR